MPITLWSVVVTTRTMERPSEVVGGRAAAARPGVIAVVTRYTSAMPARPAFAARQPTVSHHGRVTSSKEDRWLGTTGDPIRRPCPRPDSRRGPYPSTAACSLAGNSSATTTVRAPQGPPGSWECPTPSRGRGGQGSPVTPVRGLCAHKCHRGSLLVGSRARRGRRGMASPPLRVNCPELGFSLPGRAWRRHGRARRSPATGCCP